MEDRADKIIPIIFTVFVLGPIVFVVMFGFIEFLLGESGHGDDGFGDEIISFAVISFLISITVVFFVVKKITHTGGISNSGKQIGKN